MDYIAVGDLLLDTVRFADGSDSGVNAGGPVAFAYGRTAAAWCAMPVQTITRILSHG